MKKKETFEQIYERIVEKTSEKLEKLRIEAKHEEIQMAKVTAIVVTVGIALYVMFYKIFYPNKAIAEIFKFIYVCIAVIIVFVQESKKNERPKTQQYKEQFKATVIKLLLDVFYDNMTYSPYEGIERTVYNEAEVEEYDTYYSECLVQGQLNNNYNFSMSEVLTKYRTTDGKGNMQWRTLFSGMVVKMEIPKTMNTILYLREDIKDKNLFSRLLKSKYSFDQLRVQMDLQEFEEMFDVYCTDAMIARQLLTTDIMRLLMQFREEMNMEFELTIKNNCIYIRFMSGKMFETITISKFSLKKEDVYQYYKILEFTFSLMDKLKLQEST